MGRPESVVLGDCVVVAGAVEALSSSGVVSTVVGADVSATVGAASPVVPEQPASTRDSPVTKTIRRTLSRYPEHGLTRVNGLEGLRVDCLYNRASVSDSTLYFAYTALLDPNRIGEIAPGARFRFTAHYPETRLGFAASDSRAIPTLTRDPEHTVWGGVFEVPGDEVDALVAAEKAEGRRPGFAHKAVDREGNKHDCLTFVAVGQPDSDQRPSAEYLDSMIRGARHWNLPAGWVMGLQDLAEDPLFS